MVLLLTLLGLAYFALAPTGNSTFNCKRPPIVRLFNPEPELGVTEFFDAGAQCNADAHDRLLPLGLVAVGGTTLTVGAAMVERRRAHRSHRSHRSRRSDGEQIERDARSEPERSRL